MGIFVKPSIRKAAVAAFKRGDKVFVHRLHATPEKLASAIADVEVLGWELESQTAEGEGRQRPWTLTFRAKAFRWPTDQRK